MLVFSLAFLLASALHCSLALAQTSCSNPSPLPSGYAAPCPVFSVSPASVAQTGSETLSASPQPGTDYIYTTAYYANASQWLPVTLSGNNAAPSYSSGPALGSLSSAQLSSLSIGTNYVVLWDWLWDAAAQCYKGPGLNQCNTGIWRVQEFTLTAPTPTPVSGKFIIGDRIEVTNSVATVNVRSAPSYSGTILGTRPTGAQGTVVAGPTVASDGSIWWNINYDTAVDGWTIDDYLQKAGSSSYAYSQSAYAGYTYSQAAYASGCSNCNNYYVSTSGSDSNSGTQASPWRHISKAIASFSLGTGGAVIHVHAGTYSDEDINCNGFSAAICITRGGSSPTVRLKIVCDTQWSVPSSSGCLIRTSNTTSNAVAMVAIQANNVDFGALNQFGFDMSHPASNAYGMSGTCNATDHAPGHCPNGNSFHFLGNYVHDMSTQVSICVVNPVGYPGLGPFPNRHGPFVSDAQIIGNRVTTIGPQALSKLNGGSGGGGGGRGGCLNYYGMYLMGQQYLIQNNIIDNTAGYGIQAYSQPCQTVISNNTIVRTEFTNLILGGGDCVNGIAQGNVTISNNIFGQTGDDDNVTIGVPGGSGVGSAGHTVLITNNIFSGGKLGQIQVVGTNFTTVQTLKTEAPTATFVSYTGGSNDDFHLKAGSVAVNGGTTSCVSGGQSPCTPSTDFSGKTRTAPIDIGAYEQ